MKPIRTLILLMILMGMQRTASAQFAEATWRQTGSPLSAANDITTALGGGGYLMAGYIYTDTAAIFRVDDTGAYLWSKTFTNSNNDITFYSVIKTSDSAYLALGLKDFAGNMTDNSSAWLVKLDDTGAVIWEKTFGGPQQDLLFEIQEVADGSFIAVGRTTSTNVPGFHSENDLWVVKLDTAGDVEWQKAYGGSGWDEGTSILQTTSGDYLVMGSTGSPDGDVSNLLGNAGFMDVWLLKIDAAGNLLWEKTYGGTGDDWGSKIITSDTGFMTLSTVYSMDGDVSFSYGNSDIWVVKLDSNGGIIWEKTYGGNSLDGGGRIQIKETTADNYTICGRGANPSLGINGDLHCPGDGGWLFNINDTGAINWQKQFHGYAANVEITTDGGYVVAGSVYPLFSLPPTYFITRFDTTANLSCDSALSVPAVNAGIEMPIEVFPNPANEKLNIELPQGYENAQLYLSDLMGKAVYTDNASGKLKREIFVNTLPPAMYILTVVNDGEKHVFKVVCQP